MYEHRKRLGLKMCKQPWQWSEKWQLLAGGGIRCCIETLKQAMSGITTPNRNNPTKKLACRCNNQVLVQMKQNESKRQPCSQIVPTCKLVSKCEKRVRTIKKTQQHAGERKHTKHQKTHKTQETSKRGAEDTYLGASECNNDKTCQTCAKPMKKNNRSCPKLQIESTCVKQHVENYKQCSKWLDMCLGCVYVTKLHVHDETASDIKIEVASEMEIDAAKIFGPSNLSIAKPNISCTMKMFSVSTMAKTVTHSGKVNQRQSAAWPCRHEWSGHNPAKKNLLRLLCLALLASCVAGTLLTTVCSHLNRKNGERRIHRLLLRQIQLNSGRHGSDVFCITLTIHHEVQDLSSDTSSRSSGSQIFPTASFRVRRHTQSSALLLHWCPGPGGAAAAIANVFSLFFHLFDLVLSWSIHCWYFLHSLGYLLFFLIYVMLATSLSSNFTLFTYRAGRAGSCGGYLLLCTLSTDTAAAVVAHSFFIAFHPSRFFASLIHVLLFFKSLSCCRFSFLRLEEFIYFIFQSLFCSSNNSVGFALRAEFRVPSSCFHYPSFIR